jgi:hypothetical protein
MAHKQEFKEKAITLKHILDSQNWVKPPNSNKRITNVRALCDFLSISSGSLYAWEQDESLGIVPLEVLYKDEIGYDSDYNGGDHEYPKELFQNSTDRQEYAKSVNREMIQNGSINGIEFMENHSQNRNIGFGVRFWSFMAKNMNIKGYGDMNLKELKTHIGIQLLKEAGFSFPMKDLTNIAGQIGELLPKDKIGKCVGGFDFE